MSFDARSRERLEALGRTLPQKLPVPTSRQAPASPAAAAAQPRHRVEREENPEALFHALMQASADGSVPPHLLERLRSLEQSRPQESAASSSARVSKGSTTGPAAATPGSTQRPRRGRAGTPAVRAAGSDRDLYDAFEDLLRGEDDEDVTGPAPATDRRPIDDRLMPRPTLRRERPG